MCMPRCHTENRKSINIGDQVYDIYYQHDCTSCMENPSPELTVNGNKTQEVGNGMDQKVNENMMKML